MRVIRLGPIITREVSVQCQYCDSLLKLSLTDKHEERNNGFVFTCCVCGNEVWEKQDLFRLTGRGKAIADGDDEALAYIRGNNVKGGEAYNAFLAGYIKGSENQQAIASNSPDGNLLTKIRESMKEAKAAASCIINTTSQMQIFTGNWGAIWRMLYPYSGDGKEISTEESSE